MEIYIIFDLMVVKGSFHERDKSVGGGAVNLKKKMVYIGKISVARNETAWEGVVESI